MQPHVCVRVEARGGRRRGVGGGGGGGGWKRGFASYAKDDPA